MISLEIHAMVFGFQRRAHWQLSSLLEQEPWEGHEVPRMSYVMSAHASDPYRARNVDLRKSFEGLLQIQEWPVSDLTYGRRGHIRTRNLQNCQSEFLLYVDADVVYEPTFMAKLGARLEQHRGNPKVLAAPRMSMSFEDGYRLVRAATAAEMYIDPLPWAWERTAFMKTWPAAHGRISGAGFFQAIHVPTVRKFLTEKYGKVFYCAPEWNKDHDTFKDTHITRSDRYFRMLLGGIVEAPELINQVHINHYRKHDKEWANADGH